MGVADAGKAGGVGECLEGGAAGVAGGFLADSTGGFASELSTAPAPGKGLVNVCCGCCCLSLVLAGIRMPQELADALFCTVGKLRQSFSSVGTPQWWSETPIYLAMNCEGRGPRPCGPCATTSRGHQNPSKGLPVPPEPVEMPRIRSVTFTEHLLCAQPPARLWPVGIAALTTGHSLV